MNVCSEPDIYTTVPFSGPTPLICGPIGVITRIIRGQSLGLGFPRIPPILSKSTKHPNSGKKQHKENYSMCLHWEEGQGLPAIPKPSLVHLPDPGMRFSLEQRARGPSSGLTLRCLDSSLSRRCCDKSAELCEVSSWEVVPPLVGTRL